MASGFRSGNTGNGYYRYDFTYSDNGFTTQNCSFTISGGVATLTPSANDAAIRKTVSFPGASFYFIRIRIKRTGGTGWDGKIYYSISGGHGESGSFYSQMTEPAWDGSFKDIYSNMSSLTIGGTDWIDNLITNIRFDFGNNIADTFEIKFIEIYSNNWPSGVDFDSLYVRKSYFFDSNAWATGANWYGHLGDNSITTKSSPVQTVFRDSIWKQISAGYQGSSGIKSNGTLWSWGLNTNGQLGTNDRNHRSSPVQTVAGGSNWKQSSTGHSSIGGIKTDGTLWTWGLNTNGQLGTNDRNHRSSPVQTVAGGSNWKQFEMGQGSNASAIKTDGTLWVWGRNTYGELGTNNTTHYSSPVQTISGGTNWKQVSMGFYHMAAIKTDGTLWVWGTNWFGQLGTNSTVSTSSPVQTITGGTNWKQVSCGIYSTAAIKTDGSLWVWGNNSYGQLGTNNITSYSSPVQTIAGGNNWRKVSMGLYHTLAIKTDGTLWTWGRNSYGALGDNTIIHRSSPVQTIAGGNNWVSVSGGFVHSLILNSSD